MQLRNLVGVFLAASLLAGCNLPAQLPTVQFPTVQNGQQAVATVVAETLAPVQTLLPATISITATPSMSKATLSITGNSNCRKGPGASFKVVTAFTPGTDLEIVGRNTENNYWQVKIPNSEDTCWVWGQYATASGSLDTIPETTPASAASSAPHAAGQSFLQLHLFVRQFDHRAEVERHRRRRDRLSRLPL